MDFKEYWNGYVALGVAVGVSIAFNIVGFLSVGFDWVGLEKATTNTYTYTYAEEQCRRQQAQRALDGFSAFPSPKTTPTEPEAEDADRGEDDEPDWCDLEAQQSMADSTNGMEQAAWVALLLTIIGILLVWRTLYYTKATLTEARDATKAANQTVAVTRDIGIAQTRAYLVVVPEIVFDFEEGKKPRVRYEIRNTGSSPARYIHAAKIAITNQDPDAFRVRFQRDTRPHGVGFLGGGAVDRTDFALDYTMTRQIAFEFMEGRARFIFSAVVSYETVFRQRRRVVVRAYADRDCVEGGTLRFFPASRNNRGN